jgi:ketosteroid isomerase-like protein
MTTRKLVLVLGLAVAILAAAAGQILRAAAAANPADKEVLAALDLWKQAMMKKDRAAFDKVLHPDLSFGHSSGVIETKDEAIQHVVTSAAVWERVEFAETKVRVRGSTALVTGKVDYHQRGKQKLTVVNLVVLTVWTKGPQGWQMIARQATRPEAAETAAAAPAPAAPAPAAAK